MLLDSGSSHCFVSQQTVVGLPRWKALEHIAKVRVANGNEILCSHEIPDMLWSLQGHTFQSTFKVLPLGCYDVILRMDWISKHSHHGATYHYSTAPGYVEKRAYLVHHPVQLY